MYESGAYLSGQEWKWQYRIHNAEVNLECLFREDALWISDRQESKWKISFVIYTHKHMLNRWFRRSYSIWRKLSSKIYIGHIWLYKSYFLFKWTHFIECCTFHEQINLFQVFFENFWFVQPNVANINFTSQLTPNWIETSKLPIHMS